MALKISILASICFFFCSHLSAQSIVRSNISVLGSQFSNGEYTISQTIGQSSNTQSVLTSNLHVRQGFQQPISSEISNVRNELLNLNLYPNPNTGIFTLEVDLFKNEDFDFEILNILGSKVYKNQGVSNTKKEINVSFLPAGVYILRVLENSYTLGEIKFVIY